MDAVYRTDLDARLVFQVDAGICDYVGHAILGIFTIGMGIIYHVSEILGDVFFLTVFVHKFRCAFCTILKLTSQGRNKDPRGIKNGFFAQQATYGLVSTKHQVSFKLPCRDRV